MLSVPAAAAATAQAWTASMAVRSVSSPAATTPRASATGPARASRSLADSTLGENAAAPERSAARPARDFFPSLETAGSTAFASSHKTFKSTDCSSSAAPSATISRTSLAHRRSTKRVASSPGAAPTTSKSGLLSNCAKSERTQRSYGAKAIKARSAAVTAASKDDSRPVVTNAASSADFPRSPSLRSSAASALSAARRSDSSAHASTTAPSVSRAIKECAWGSSVDAFAPAINAPRMSMTSPRAFESAPSGTTSKSPLTLGAKKGKNDSGTI
mmetsp:Transcript_11251/g.37552  ORF Transcript_11251/g.37552 Transcript_11251/m.37552 type:complete len:273 (+) Transcript_11251:762-1580(+)